MVFKQCISLFFIQNIQQKMNKKNTSTLIRLIVWLAFMGLLTLGAIGVWALFPDRTSVVSLKWLQFLQTLAMFFLPPLLMAFFCCEKPLQWLHLDRGMKWQTALFAVVLMLCAIPGINLLSYLNQQLTLPTFLEPLEALMRNQEDAANQLTEQFLQVNGIEGLLINVGLMALLPAMSEELTFRGTIQSFFANSPDSNGVFTSAKSLSVRTKIGIWATAIIFSFVHFQFYGFVPRMLMGAMFGYMLAWTGSLWVPMLMHFTNNAVAVLSYYITYNYSLDPDSLDSIGTSSTLWMGILSILLVLTALICYPHYLQKQANK